MPSPHRLLLDRGRRSCPLLSSRPCFHLFSRCSWSVIFSEHKPDHLIGLLQKLLIVLMWLSPYLDPGLRSSFIFPHSLAFHSAFQVDLRMLCDHPAFHRGLKSTGLTSSVEIPILCSKLIFPSSLAASEYFKCFPLVLLQ